MFLNFSFWWNREKERIAVKYSLTDDLNFLSSKYISLHATLRHALRLCGHCIFSIGGIGIGHGIACALGIIIWFMIRIIRKNIWFCINSICILGCMRLFGWVNMDICTVYCEHSCNFIVICFVITEFWICLTSIWMMWIWFRSNFGVW